jgi:hypothetical protein
MAERIEALKGAVERYLGWGLAVIPAVHGQKRPEVEWREYQEEPPKPKQVRDWFGDGRAHNIAIICGPASGNLVVLDFDDPEVYPRFFRPEEIEAETPVVRTGGGGIHVYLRAEGPVRSFRIPELKLEVRGAGNIVIAPPSIHPSGRPYEFANPGVEGIAVIKDLEESIWERARELGVKPPEPLLEEELAEHPGQPYAGEDPPCIAKLLQGVEEGFRNEAAIRLASYYLKFRLIASEEAVLRILREWNRRNRPPLPDGELRGVVRSAARLDRGYGCRHNGPWCDMQACPLKRRALLRKEIDEEAERILSQPDVLAALGPHLDNILAGEGENKALCFVLLLSGKMTDPAMKQIILLKSEPGAGKTTLMRLADAFRTKTVGRFTAHALDYADLEGYEVLRLQEIGSMDQEAQGVSTIKFLSSDDKGYTVEATERDPATGRFTTRQYRIPPITLLTSTARVEVDPQFERRAWILNPDESEEQTRRVREWKARHEREKGLVALGLMRETSHERSMAVLRAVVKKLEPCDVVLPFPGAISRVLRTERLRARGDYDKLFALVKLHAFLHQRTLPRLMGRNGNRVVLATPESALRALRLAAKPYATMTSELEERGRRLISALRDMGVEREGDEIDPEAREGLAKRLGRSERTVGRYLDAWVRAGYMSKRGGRRGGGPVVYKLLYDLASVEERSSGMWDIGDATAKFISDSREEAEMWLDGVLDKMALADGHSEEGPLQALRMPPLAKPPPPPGGFEERPFAEQVLSNTPLERDLGPDRMEGLVSLVASQMSKVPVSNSENGLKDGGSESAMGMPAQGGHGGLYGDAGGSLGLGRAEDMAAGALGNGGKAEALLERPEDPDGLWGASAPDLRPRAEACSLCGRPIADGLSNASYLDGRPAHLLCPTDSPVDPAQAPEVALGALRALGGPFDRIKGLLALGRALGGLQAAEVWWGRLARDGLLAEIPGGLWALTR